MFRTMVSTMACVLSSYCIAYSLLFLVKSAGNTMAVGLSDTKQSAENIGNDIEKLVRAVTNYDEIEKKYRSVPLSSEKRNGMAVVIKMKQQLESVLQSKIHTVMTLAEKAEELRSNYTYDEKLEQFQFYNSKYLEGENYLELEKKASFADKLVNMTYSTVHIPTDVYNGSEAILNSAKWTQPMNKYFIGNMNQTGNSLLWQILGTSTGVYRFYPGYKWPKENSNDFFDHRRRGWYIQGSSSPKDMVILLDLSGSMVGNKLAIVKLAATILLDTLQENDFVNIVTFNKGARMLCEESTVRNKSAAVRAKACTKDTLLQATIQNKKYLKEMVAHVQATEVAQVSEGFKKAIDLLEKTRSSNRSSTQCLRTINFFTDGVEDNEGDLTMDVLKNSKAKERGIRVFGYLVGREKGSPYKPVQKFACATKGYFYTIETLSDVRENVSPYLSVLGRPQGFSASIQRPVTWTPIYLDGGGLGLMITVVAPIYDAKHADKLLGVVGTDVALPQLNDSVPSAEIGVNGFGFAINNNGFILFHPMLKEGYPSDDGIEAVDLEDPPNLVLADVNLKEYKESLENLSRHLIDRETGSKSLKLRIISKDLNKRRIKQKKKRISRERSYHFYYTLINDTSFSSAVAISKVGEHFLKAQNQTVNKDTKNLFNATDGEIFMVAPWRICERIIPKARDTTPLYIPTYADAEDFAEKLHSVDQCNRELLNRLLVDASALKDIRFDVQKNDTRGYLSAFVGTSGGLTKVLAPGRESPVSRDVTREPYYQRAADLETKVVVSAPYMAPKVTKDQNDTIILTASFSLFKEQALAAVVGMQMKDDVLKEVIFNNSKVCKDTDDWSCFLIDEDGYIVASSTNDSKSEVGKHFGAVYGPVMRKMIEDKIFLNLTFDDTQSKCSKQSASGSNAMRLINPFLAVSTYVTWMTQTLFWSLVQFNIFSFFSGKSQAVAQDGGASDKEFCTMNIPFFKANNASVLFTNGYEYQSTNCPDVTSCLSSFSIAQVAKTNLFLVNVKNCECKGQKPIRTVPKRVESVPFFAPAERYRSLPQLKCYNSSQNESNECGSGSALLPKRLLVTLLMPAYFFLVH